MQSQALEPAQLLIVPEVGKITGSLSGTEGGQLVWMVSSSAVSLVSLISLSMYTHLGGMGVFAESFVGVRSLQRLLHATWARPHALPN